MAFQLFQLSDRIIGFDPSKIIQITFKHQQAIQRTAQFQQLAGLTGVHTPVNAVNDDRGPSITIQVTSPDRSTGWIEIYSEVAEELYMKLLPFLRGGQRHEAPAPPTT